MKILELRNVTKIYGKDGVKTKALDGVSLSVDAGEFVAVMGASGSGKTTLLNLIATIDDVSGGSILVDGRDVTAMSDEELAVRGLFLRETCLLFGRIRSECAEIFAVNAAVIGACGAIAVGARIPCADPKPPQIRKKIAQARQSG